ncbi:MAG: hypothetical protein UY33_C0029G0013 [Candidatus Amesbacteria bacterium GW2011_GWA1_48_9]|nr:MAG: hypothetical protein UY33_C0029G0013 [Candidatus Amesbacteria bacterium GW2011_GWA1_48_9]
MTEGDYQAAKAIVEARRSGSVVDLIAALTRFLTPGWRPQKAKTREWKEEMKRIGRKKPKI